jgi:hypothetical protein
MGVCVEGGGGGRREETKIYLNMCNFRSDIINMCAVIALI